MNGFFKKFRRDVAGIAWLGATLFLGLALFSFHPSDPSFNSTGVNLKVRNYCGYIGSFSADLIFQIWGLGAWLLVAACGRFCVSTFRNVGTKLVGPRVIGGVLSLTVVASLLSLHLPAKKIYGNHIPVGGLVGTVVSKGLVSALNFVGVSIILWCLAILLLVFFTDRSLFDLFRYPQALYNKLAEALSARGFTFRALFDGGLEPQPAGAGAGGGTIAPKRERKKKDAEAVAALSPEPKPLVIKEREEEEDEEEADEEEERAEDAPAVAPKAGLLARMKIGTDVPRRKVKLATKVERRIENWKLPSLDLLEDPPASRVKIDRAEIDMKARIVVDKFAQFNVKGEVTAVKPGPAVTMFEFKPNADVRISRITDLADDLKLALSSESVRIIAPIPGRDVVGIETANSQREMVFLKDILATDPFWADGAKLPLCLGRQADGEPKVIDLRKIPHLLVAGTTGSGKSVFVVSCITGLLFKHSPKTLRLVLIDPKQVDLTIFANIPHLIMPPIADSKKAVLGLKWAVREMEKRYRSLAKFKARGLEAFNEAVSKLTEEEVKQHEATNAEWEQDARKLEQYYFQPLPYVVIVVEEFADLMMVDKQNVEGLVVRLAQMARAAGMHLILATQSPRKDVVTGLIKTNVPGRMAFKVASKLDSRIVMDEGGAERLLPNGDNLYSAPGVGQPARHQAPWISEPEITGVIKFWSEQGEPQYDALALKALEGSGGGYDLGGGDGGDGFGGDGENEYDEKYDEILAWVSTQKAVSASLLQRKFSLGYPRAARMIEIFEREGVVGPANGSKPRQVLVSSLADK